MTGLPRRPISQAELIANARGLAFAALAPVDAIARVLGCDEAQAADLKGNALDDFQSLLVAVRQARGGGRS